MGRVMACRDTFELIRKRRGRKGRGEMGGRESE